MNITYLIGNGFDISCGLKTRYVDFINEYLEAEPDDPDIRNFKKLIADDYCTWSDAELAFGLLTEKIENATKFRKCFRDFLIGLNAYFIKQEASFNCSAISNEESTTFLTGLKHFHILLKEESKEILESCVGSTDKNHLTYNFIIFNYTGLFEKILRCSIPENSNDLGFIKIGTKTYPCQLGSIEYAHGSLSSPPLIFGVNDPEQISHSILRNNRQLIQTMVKPVESLDTRANSYNRCKKLIQKSDIICTYGMSIGATDSTWWNEILTRLSTEEHTNLLIYQWNPDCNKTLAGDIIKETKKCKNKLIKSAKVDFEVVTGVKERIHVLINENPFHISMHV